MWECMGYKVQDFFFKKKSYESDKKKCASSISVQGDQVTARSGAGSEWHSSPLCFPTCLRGAGFALELSRGCCVLWQESRGGGAEGLASGVMRPAGARLAVWRDTAREVTWSSAAEAAHSRPATLQVGRLMRGSQIPAGSSARFGSPFLPRCLSTRPIEPSQFVLILFCWIPSLQFDFPPPSLLNSIPSIHFGCCQARLVDFSLILATNSTSSLFFSSTSV